MPTTARRADRNTVRREAMATFTVDSSTNRGRPSTIDTAARTVRAIIATDEPVVVYDWERDEQIAEVLVPSGMIEPARMRLRTDHNRWGVRAVIGRVEGFDIRENEVEATLRFSAAADVDEVFQRVADGAVDAVSIGASYRMADAVDIEPGKTEIIDGVRYTANEIPKRIVRKWTPDETSIVDEGADPRAVIRSAAGSTPRHQKNRDRIRTAGTYGTQSGHEPGTRAHTTPEDRQMPVKQRSRKATKPTSRERVRPDNDRRRTTTRAATPAADTDTAAFDPAPDTDDSDDADGDGDESEPAQTRRRKPSAEVVRVAQELEAMRARADRATASRDADATPDQFENGRRAERERVAQITELGQGLPAQFVERAIREGWDVERFSTTALQRLAARSQRSPARQGGNGVDRAPAVHRAEGASIEALQAAALMRAGIKLDNPVFATPEAAFILEKNHLGWLHRMATGATDRDNGATQRAVEAGRRFSSNSASRLCERLLDVRGERKSSDDEEAMVQRAMSNPYLPRVFGAIISAGLVQGFLEYDDQTVGMADEKDWPDFREVQPIGIDGTQGLRRHTRRTTAKDIDVAEYGERYAVARYTGKWEIDEMDMIDDIVGVNEMMPQQMGALARELRPNLFVALLQSNAALSDGTPLFDAARGNLLSSPARPWSLDNLAVAEAAMANQTVATKSGKTKARNLQAGYVFVPRNLRAAAKRDITSTVIVSGNTTDRGASNWAAGDYQLRSDARLAVGVTDPRNELQTTGNAARWYVFEQSGRMFCQFGYRRGTGRVPQLRPRPLTAPGQWGWAWDIAFDIGIGVLSPAAAVRCDG